jgi:hypothetical protein
MPRLSNLLRPSIKRDKVRREYRKQIGVFEETYLAAVNGAVRIPGGKYWVHDLKGADTNGNATYGQEYQLPLKPGASIDPRPNWKVNTIWIRGVRYIESMDFDELKRIGYDPHQTNPLDPSLKFSLIEHLQNLQSFPNGNATVRVMPSIYRKADGTYGLFATMDEDILTGNVPSANTQVVVCLWLQNESTIAVTVSSEETANTDLKQDTVTALTLINECAAAAPFGMTQQHSPIKTNSMIYAGLSARRIVAIADSPIRLTIPAQSRTNISKLYTINSRLKTVDNSLSKMADNW